MHKELLEALKAKFQGVSENILSRIATKLAKTATTEEQVKTSVDELTLQQVIDSYADSRATEATQTAVHHYEQKHSLKNGVKIERVDDIKDTQEVGAEMPEWAKTLVESNKQLTERLAAFEAERTTTSRKQRLSEITKRLPESLRKAYERTSVNELSEDEFTSLLEEVGTEVDGIVKETTQKGAVFGRPSAPGGTDTSGTLSEEQQKAIAHREGIPSPEGQPF